MFRQRGQTIIELFCVLGIIGILLGTAAPTVTRMLSRSEATTRINWIIGAVNYTRHAAVSFRTMATLCPIDLTKTVPECGRTWTNDLMVFADRNEDGKFNGNDKLLQRIAAPERHGSLNWRAFRNRQYLQITPYGYTNYQNGNFTYCSPDHDPTLARQIVVNVQGRARVIHHKDDTGVRLDRKGKKLRC
ncbi:MAG: Tfp pilus assembly protein FimT/FimU [Pseudomonadales bacterium]